jgi:hypothetical protein
MVGLVHKLQCLNPKEKLNLVPKASGTLEYNNKTNNKMKQLLMLLTLGREIFFSF